MPAYTYTGAGSRSYPETRDTHGEITGTVEPGDQRDYEDPPDEHWKDTPDTAPPTWVPAVPADDAETPDDTADAESADDTTDAAETADDTADVPDTSPPAEPAPDTGTQED